MASTKARLLKHDFPVHGKRNAVFGARFKGLSLHFLYQKKGI